jgi:flagellar basal-body rod modification protein FlgD
MSSTISGALDNITSYTDSMADKKKSDDDLGMTDFLTMLTAQLQHQDPLNPMESQDFTAQLTQFSQLEAQFKSQETLEKIAASLSAQEGKSAESYLEKHVTASVDTVDVTSGTATGGYYTIEENADITISIYNEKSEVVRTLNLGQKNAGSYPLQWDGKDSAGNIAPDGTYKYSVQALTANGFAPVNTSISGQVESILYQGDKEYLVVKGVIISPDSVVELKNETTQDYDPDEGSYDYLGKTIGASQGIVNVKDGSVNTKLPTFKLDSDDSARINVLNSLGQIVYSYHNGDIKGGEDTQFEWDGKDLNGDAAPDGYYMFEVIASGGSNRVDKSLKGEVTGVYYDNNRHFLDIDGVRVAPENIVSIEG